jgi:1-acyl-sn-glycerol-3-phosphate acyltransferase
VVRVRSPGHRNAGRWIWLAVVLVKPINRVLFTRRWGGQEHVPPTGGVVLVSNHVSQADFLTMAEYVWDSGRIPRFLIKDSLFRLRGVGRLLGGAKQIPVSRGTAAARKSLEQAHAALARGEAVCIYPEGTVTRDPGFWPMQARTGVARLALSTDAPIVPVCNWGPQHALDVEHRKIRPFPRHEVWCAAGPPVDLSAYRGRPLTAELLREVTDVIMAAVRDQLAKVRGETPPPEFFRRPPAREAS